MRIAGGALHVHVPEVRADEQLLDDERERVRNDALSALTEPKNQPPSDRAPSPPQTGEDLPG